MLLYVQGLFAQENNIIHTLFENNKAGKSFYLNEKALFELNSYSHILDNCNEYLNSEDESDRIMALRLTLKVAESSDELITKHAAVYNLVDKGLRDNSKTIRSSVLNYLNKLPVSYFDDLSKNCLANIIINSRNYYKQLVMLSGKLQMHQLVFHYENRLKTDSALTNNDKWGMQLSLGRMGNTGMVNKCVNQVRKIGMDNLIIYNVIPDLLYLNNKYVTDYLLDELRKQNLNCTTADPDNEMIIDCAYRLAELVAPYIKDFPFEVAVSGDLECNNYRKSLHDIRNWIIKNRDNYQPVFLE